MAAVASTKKSVGVKIINLILAALSFVGTIILLKSGVFDFIGSWAVGFLKLSETPVSGSKAVGTTVIGLINYVARVSSFTLVFWVMYWVLKLIALIIIKAAKLEKRGGFQPPKRAGGAFVVGIIGFITCWFCCFITFMPLSSVVALAEKTVNTADSEDNKGTYSYELAVSIKDTFEFVKEDSIFKKAKKYSGADALCEVALSVISDIEIENNVGNKVNANFHKFINGSIGAGIKGLNAYEKYMSSNGKYGDFTTVNYILGYVAESNPLLLSAGELAGSRLFDDSDDHNLKRIQNTMNEMYVTDRNAVENARNDITVTNKILKDFLTAHKDERFDSEDLILSFVKYATDSDNVSGLVNDLSQLSIYQGSFEALCKYGVQELCILLKIDYTEDEAYDSFINKLFERVNNKSIGNIDMRLTDEFIKRIVQEDISVAEYKAQYKNDPDAMDWYENYKRFSDKYKEFADLFNSYKVETDDDGVKLRIIDGNVYAYDKETDKWKVETSPSGRFINVAALNNFLVKYYSENYSYTTEISYDRLKSDLNGVSAATLSAYNVLGSDYVDYNLTVFGKYADKEKFTTGKVLGFDMEEKISVKQQVDTERDNGAISDILILAGGIYETITTEKHEEMTDVILSHFGEIGQILDALNKFSITEDVPELMVRAISENDEFSQYFKAKNVDTIIEKTESGETTYAEFFLTIQSLYNIAKEIM